MWIKQNLNREQVQYVDNVVPVERVGVDLTLEKRTSLVGDLVVRWNVERPSGMRACLMSPLPSRAGSIPSR